MELLFYKNLTDSYLFEMYNIFVQVKECICRILKCICPNDKKVFCPAKCILSESQKKVNTLEVGNATVYNSLVKF